MITKKEIRKRMGKIKKLDKAHEVCILNEDLQGLLEEEARQQMFTLLTQVEKRLLKENASEGTIEKLGNYRENLNTSRTVNGEYNGIWACIGLCMIFIKVYVL